MFCSQNVSVNVTASFTFYLFIYFLTNQMLPITMFPALN
uniref:Uncharacterized protein n=1 Tax=Anguilla anguilla TaxID=7936 RepID=A0A0E9RQR9_ANGAN